MTENIHYLVPEQIHAILNAIPEVSRHTERDTLLFEVLWQTGARICEVTTLVPEHIGMSSLVLRNLKQQKRVKTKQGYVREHDSNAVKEVEITKELCDKIKEYCKQHDIRSGQWIFPSNRDLNKPLSRWYAWDIICKASEQAQIFVFGKRNPSTGGRFKGAYPHMFRHSCAVHLLEETDNVELVRRHLGHSRITTTQTYITVKPEKMKNTIQRMDW